MTVSPTDPLRETEGIQGTSPITPQPSPDPTKAEPQKEFQGPEKLEQKQTQETQKPSPMEIAKDSAQKNADQSGPEKVEEKINQFQEKMQMMKGQLQNPPQRLEDAHYQALSQVAKETNKNLNAAARAAGAEHTAVTQKSGQRVQDFLADWIDGGQKTMGNVLESLPNLKGGDLGQFMRIQMSVQRATQRVELMSSIIGSTVGGINKLMQTQLG